MFPKTVCIHISICTWAHREHLERGGQSWEKRRKVTGWTFCLTDSNGADQIFLLGFSNSLMLSVGAGRDALQCLAKLSWKSVRSEAKNIFSTNEKPSVPFYCPILYCKTDIKSWWKPTCSICASDFKRQACSRFLYFLFVFFVAFRCSSQQSLLACVTTK